MIERPLRLPGRGKGLGSEGCRGEGEGKEGDRVRKEETGKDRERKRDVGRCTRLIWVEKDSCPWTERR